MSKTRKELPSLAQLPYTEGLSVHCAQTIALPCHVASTGNRNWKINTFWVEDAVYAVWGCAPTFGLSLPGRVPVLLVGPIGIGMAG